MYRRLRRAALIASLAAALSALAAASAQAVTLPTPTTLAATSVTTTSAVLNGTVNPNGLPAAWEFVYGPNAAHLVYTKVASLAAGTTAAPVSVTVTGLSPGTTYSFALLASNQNNLTYHSYYGFFVAGKTLLFTTAKATKPQVGTLKLTSTNLKVKKGKVSIRLQCKSTLSCKGKLSITARGKLPNAKKSKNFTCVSRKSFSIKPGKKSTVKAGLSKSCKTLLDNAHKHKLKASLTAKLTTGQPKLKKGVTLKGK
jgi:hypothetical protein